MTALTKAMALELGPHKVGMGWGHGVGAGVQGLGLGMRMGTGVMRVLGTTKGSRHWVQGLTKHSKSPRRGLWELG